MVAYRIKITVIIIFDGCIAAGIGAVFIIYFQNHVNQVFLQIKGGALEKAGLSGFF